MDLSVAIGAIDEILVTMDRTVPCISPPHLCETWSIPFEFLATTICAMCRRDIEHESELLYRVVVSGPFPHVQNSSELGHVDSVFEDFAVFIWIWVRNRIVWRYAHVCQTVILLIAVRWHSKNTSGTST